MNEVTQQLRAFCNDERQASADLLPLVYEELRRLAAQKLSQEPTGQTLLGTALVHEAYLRLVSESDADAVFKTDRISPPETGDLRSSNRGSVRRPATTCIVLKIVRLPLNRLVLLSVSVSLLPRLLLRLRFACAFLKISPRACFHNDKEWPQAEVLKIPSSLL